jgi:hypothetical protein
MAVFQKAKSIQAVCLTPSQARAAILEAAGIAGVSLPGATGASMPNRGGFSAGSGRGRIGGGPLVPTAHQTSPRQTDMTGPTLRPSSTVPSLPLQQIAVAAELQQKQQTLGKSNDLLMVGAHGDKGCVRCLFAWRLFHVR